MNATANAPARADLPKARAKRKSDTVTGKHEEPGMTKAPNGIACTIAEHWAGLAANLAAVESAIAALLDTAPSGTHFHRLVEMAQNFIEMNSGTLGGTHHDAYTIDLVRTDLMEALALLAGSTALADKNADADFANTVIDVSTLIFCLVQELDIVNIERYLASKSVEHVQGPVPTSTASVPSPEETIHDDGVMDSERANICLQAVWEANALLDMISTQVDQEVEDGNQFARKFHGVHIRMTKLFSLIMSGLGEPKFTNDRLLALYDGESA